MRLSWTQARGPTVALALLMVPIGLFLQLVVEPAWQTYRDNEAEIVHLHDQIERLRDASADLEALERRLEMLRDRHAASRYTLSQEGETMAAAALQERVKGLVNDHGGRLVSTRVLPVEQQGEFVRVGVKVQMRGPVTTIRNVLHELETGEPMLLVEDVLIEAKSEHFRRRRQSGEDRREGDLDLRFDLAGFIRKEAAS